MAERLAANISKSALVTGNATEAVTVLAAGVCRVNGYIKNLSTAKLFLKEGAGCSDSDFSDILVGGSAEDDGYGGAHMIGTYPGIVTVYSASPVRVIVVEHL